MVSKQDEELRKDTPIFLSKDANTAQKMPDNNNYKPKWEEIERRIDKFTFISALIFIIVFNIVYWFSALM